MHPLFNKIRKIISKNKNLYWVSIKLYNFINTTKLFFLTKKKYYSVITVKNHCEKTGDKYILLEAEEQRAVYFPKYFEDEEKEKCIYYESPEIYISELEDSQVVGDNFFIINNNNCLYDFIGYKELGNSKIEYSSVVKYDEKKIYIRSYDSKQILESGIFLLGHPSGNYYHFMIDILSKLYYVEKFESYKNMPLLIDEKGVERFKQVIDFFNINNHPIIPIKKNHCYTVKKLVYPSRNTFSSIYEKNEGNKSYFSKILSNSAFKFYNKLANPKQLNGHRRVYVSRFKSDRLINENIISKLFKLYGFEIVYLENMSFSEQIELLSETEYFVGAKGAGFANIIFLPQNAKVACIVPKSEDYVLFSTLSYNMSIDITYLNCETVKNSTYYVDPDYCERWLINEGFKKIGV